MSLLLVVVLVLLVLLLLLLVVLLLAGGGGACCCCYCNTAVLAAKSAADVGFCVLPRTPFCAGAPPSHVRFIVQYNSDFPHFHT